MMATAVVGYKAIEKLSLIVVPLLLILLLVTIVRVAQDHSFSDVLAIVPESPASLGVLVSIVAGGMAVGAVIMPDISRYARSSRDAVGGALFGFLGGFPLFVALAMYLGFATGNGDFTANMIGIHSGLWSFFALFTIVFATWTTNDNNLYSAALALNSLFPKTAKWRVTLIAGICGTILAMLGILSHFMNWMLVLSVSIPPIGAVMAVDFFLFRRYAYDPAVESELPAVRWQAFASWGFGLFIGLLTYYKVFAFTTAPALDAIIASSVAYCVVMLASGARFRLGAAAPRAVLPRPTPVREGAVD
jgi:cytosine permease